MSGETKEQTPELENSMAPLPKKKKTPYVMSEESAEEQMDVLLDYYEVNPDKKYPEDSDELKAFNSLKADMVDGVRRGKIYFEDDENGFIIIQKLKSGTPVKYYEIDGNSKVMMGKYINHTQKVYALLAAMTKDLDHLNIRKFKGPDSSRADLI